jgi:hypothetical protein
MNELTGRTAETVIIDDPIREPLPIKRMGLMWDTESLGLPSGTMIYDIGFVAFDLDDPDTIVKDVNEHLPLRPQAKLGRFVDVDWLPYFLKMGPAKQKVILDNIDGDMDELLALIRSILRKYQQVTEGVPHVENWFARPQHDIPLIQDLLQSCGEKLPWPYDSVNDLRTLMNQAGMSARDPKTKELAHGLTLHTARGDCLYQIRCYVEAQRQLRSSV